MANKHSGHNHARLFHDPTLSRTKVIPTRQPPTQPNQPFQPLPPPSGTGPYHLSLADIVPAEQIQSITTSGRIVFHLAGDTGGVRRPEAQQIVANHMVEDFEAPDAPSRPAFFYHLGDVVYFYGQANEYFAQFYEPYDHYPAPIFAIPGNHDGDLDPLHAEVRSLTAFVNNFCAKELHFTQEAEDVSRHAMTQPNVYWTLEAPFVTIVGLYTNVPEGGEIQEPQLRWLVQELQTAPTDKALLVAMHHPIYSADGHHSGSERMRQVLDTATRQAKRIPDAVLAGHVHNYQRFTHPEQGRQVPYIVAGAGGYWHLHPVLKGPSRELETPVQIPDTDLILESYCDDRHGFLRLEVTKESLTGSYFTVPRPQESWSSPARRIDLFTLSLKEHQLVPSPVNHRVLAGAR